MTNMLPWQHVTDEQARRFEAELRRELTADHVLSERTYRAVARRQDCDEVLFEVDSVGFAVVHLTWSAETGPCWPSTEVYASLSDWIERRMKPDHEAF